MSVSEGLKGTLSIINAAGTILDASNPRHARAIQQHDKVKKGATYAAKVADRLDRAGGAITDISAQTTILSRVFIDENILDEPILPNLMRTTHEWYGAQIIAALHLSQMVSSTHTVQDVMSVVQTGHNNRQRGLLEHIADRNIGVESFLSAYLGGAGMEAYDAADPFVLHTREESDELARREAAVTQRESELHNKPSELSVRSVNTSEHRIGPMGELFEVKLSNPNGNGQSITVPVFIQMQPSIVSGDVAPRFIDMNVAPTYWQRWTQMRAGELSFWKDFVLNRDLIKRQKSLIKDPKTAAAFSEFLRTVAKKDKYAIDDATDKLGSRQSANLANSVIVFSEESVMRAKADSGVDLHNDRDRDRYFRDTYSMIVIIIDPLHQRVTVYFNGLDGTINAPYSDFKPKDSKFDPKEFMSALQAFSSNNIGRMR